MIEQDSVAYLRDEPIIKSHASRARSRTPPMHLVLSYRIVESLQGAMRHDDFTMMGL